MDPISAAIIEMYALARELPLERFHDAALNILKSLVPFDSAIWGTGRMAAAGLTYHSVHLHNEPQEIGESYAEVKQQDLVAFALWRGEPVTETFHTPALYRSRDRAGIRAHARKFGHLNAMISGEINPVGLADWIALYRARPDQIYRGQEQELASLVCAHMREALRIACALQMEREGTAMSGMGRAVVDVKGAFYRCEPRFLELLKMEFSQGIGDRLPQALTDFFCANNTRFKGNAIVVQCKWIKSLMFLTAREKTAVDALSARELTIAREVAEGKSYKEIALKLGIAPATVRSHIQRIHEKLGARTNAEIATRLLLATMSPPRPTSW